MLKIAEYAAYEAGKILKEYFGNIKKEDIREKEKNDFLTFVDEKSEQKIIKIISEKFPDHSFLAEEGGGKTSKGSHTWIIDPLDGTKNFICNVPMFAVSIAPLQNENKITHGVIYDVMHDQMYCAQINKGATVNGKKICVNSTSTLEKSILGTGFPFRAKFFLKSYLDCFEDIFNGSSGMRRFGAAALDLAYVACGRFEGFWELGLMPWDVAAGTIILKEAGGEITDFWNHAENYLHNTFVVATNGKIHEDLIKIINRYFPEEQKVFK